MLDRVRRRPEHPKLAAASMKDNRQRRRVLERGGAQFRRREPAAVAIPPITPMRTATPSPVGAMLHPDVARSNQRQSAGIADVAGRSAERLAVRRSRARTAGRQPGRWRASAGPGRRRHPALRRGAVGGDPQRQCIARDQAFDAARGAAPDPGLGRSSALFAADADCRHPGQGDADRQKDGRQDEQQLGRRRQREKPRRKWSASKLSGPAA